MKGYVRIRFHVMSTVCEQLLQPLQAIEDMPPWVSRHKKNMSLAERYDEHLGDMSASISRMRHLVGLEPLPK